MLDKADDKVAVYACRSAFSQGRQIPQEDAPTRTTFQRDRDRIVHSSAFRRLVYKTQVFVNHEGDMFRTRLTHSLEVAQLGRSIARTLGLNEDLVEAIALAHDLGHTPFGHAGQDELNVCMQPYGGFEHNIQSLRVVDRLEKRYPAFDGLNLCFETREGILKHCSAARAALLGDVGKRFLNKKRPSMEAQLTNLADEIAYNAHDIDDGVRSGLLTLEQVKEVPLFEYWCSVTLKAYPGLKGKRLLFETIRQMLSAQVYDVIDETQRRLQMYQPKSVDEVRCAPMLVDFSLSMKKMSGELKSFLMKNLYRHPQVEENMAKARQVIKGLFEIYMHSPHEMSDVLVAKVKPRDVSDYIAGMTDRFAIHAYERLTGHRLFSDSLSGSKWQ